MVRLDAHSSSWRALLAALFVAFGCRTPPPLPRTAEAPGEPAPASREPTALPAPPPAPAPPPRDAPPVETEPEHDFAAEQQELTVRYGDKKALATLRGEASYYGKAFAGRKTASGEVFDPARSTAAHRTLPFGTVLRVTRVETREKVYVKVNDRGPFGKRRRIIDLSEGAARELDMLRIGVCEVRVEVLERGKEKPKKRRSQRRKKR